MKKVYINVLHFSPSGILSPSLGCSDYIYIQGILESFKYSGSMSNYDPTSTL